MSKWQGSARTNYVRIKDVGGLEVALAPFEGMVEESAKLGTDELCFVATTDDGGWPGFVHDENGQEVGFDFAQVVCPFMEDGEILVAMEAGHEAHRLITGNAVAYNRDGERVAIALDDIYTKAAEAFGVTKNRITQCAY